LQGELAHGKNGDELFWKDKFHVANGKAQAWTQGALPFSLLSMGGGGGRIFFHFPLVPNMFPPCSLKVLNGFPLGSQNVPH